MKVYIAAPWVRKADAVRAGEMATAAGLIVTSRWFNHEGDPADSTGITVRDSEIHHQVLEDMADIYSADYLMVLNLERSEGKAVETGIAIQLGIPFVCVGPRSNVFQILSEGMFDSVYDAIQYLLKQ